METQSAIEKILKGENQDNNKDRETEPAAGDGPGLQDAYTALASALRVVENGDRAAPSQAIEVYQESSQQIKARIAEWTRFKHTPLEQLNRQLRQANFAPVTIADGAATITQSSY